MDPIANLLTSIRNASNARQSRVFVNHSNVKESICEILKELNIIIDFKVNDDKGKKNIQIEIQNQKHVSHLKRVSKPGHRVYTKSKDIKSPLSGLGYLIISTPSGLMEGRKAKKMGLGGEVICEIW